MSTSIIDARAAVRRAITAVTDTLAREELAAWRAELDLLREVESSLTERLNARRLRQAVAPGVRP